jgi:hypothetical protein
MLHMTIRILTTVFEIVSKSIKKYIKQYPHRLLILLLNYAQRSVPYSVNNIENGLAYVYQMFWLSVPTNHLAIILAGMS